MEPDQLPMILIPAGVIIFIVIIVLVLRYAMKAMKKAEQVGKEVVEQFWEDMKLASECTLGKGFVPKPGILVMLKDRLVFIPFMSDTKLEIPFSQITKLTPLKFSSQNQTKGFELYLGDEKMRFYVNIYLFPVWKVALEKNIPALGTMSYTPPIK